MIQNQIEKLFPSKTTFLLACSGGVDSICLASAFNSLQIPFRLIHVNYGLRGNESDLDQKFLSEWATEKQVELVIGSAKEDMQLESGNIQQRARAWRYRFFKSNLRENEILVTAHHQDDQLEGFFISLKRKEKWESQAGMSVWNGFVYRPFLLKSRDEINSYAQANDIEWREDSSNQSDKYLRNRIRNSFFPVLDSFSKEWRRDVLDIQSILEKAAAEKQRRLERWKSDFLVIGNNSFQFDPAGFKEEHLSLAISFLAQFGKIDTVALKNILSKSGKHIRIGKYFFETTSSRYLLIKDDSNALNELAFVVGEQRLDSSNLVNSSIESCLGEMKLSSQIAYLDTDKLVLPLSWRHPKSGDRFFPIGMKGSKKVSDFLNERGLSLIEKKNIWLLTSDNHVAWIAGYRIDRRFAANDETSKAYFVRLTQEVIP